MADRLRERFPDVYVTGALYMNSSDAKLLQSEYVESCTRSELPLEGDIAESGIHFDSRLLDTEDCPQQLYFDGVEITMPHPEKMEKLLDIEFIGTTYLEIDFLNSDGIYSAEDEALAEEYRVKLNEKYPDMQINIIFPVG